MTEEIRNEELNEEMTNEAEIIDFDPEMDEDIDEEVEDGIGTLVKAGLFAAGVAGGIAICKAKEALAKRKDEKAKQDEKKKVLNGLIDKFRKKKETVDVEAEELFEDDETPVEEELKSEEK